MTLGHSNAPGALASLISWQLGQMQAGLSHRWAPVTPVAVVQPNLWAFWAPLWTPPAWGTGLLSSSTVWPDVILRPGSSLLNKSLRCSLPFRNQMTCCLKHSISHDHRPPVHAPSLLCVTNILVLLHIANLKVPSGFSLRSFLRGVCSVLYNSRQKFDRCLNKPTQAGRYNIETRMWMGDTNGDADGDAHGEVVCGVGQPGTLIWEVGRHLPLRGVVRMRGSGCLRYYFNNLCSPWQHLQQCILITYLIICFSSRPVTGLWPWTCSSFFYLFCLIKCVILGAQ